MVFRLTSGNTMMDTYTQNQARLARAQRLFDAARILTGIPADKTRLDRLLALYQHPVRQTRQAAVWPANNPVSGLLVAAGQDGPGRLFSALAKRDDRDNRRNNLVLLAFSAPTRREKPRNSMRTGYLAADVGRPERLNRAPEC